MADLKLPADGVDDRRHSKRPVWRSLKVATNTGSPSESHNNHGAISTSFNMTNDQPKTSGDIPKSRLSNWLSQQLNEHERQSHYSPSWIDDRETTTLSNISLVSHISSTTGASDGRRPSSALTSPTSPTIPRLLMTPSTANSIPSLKPRLMTVMTAKMIPPSSPTASTLSGTSSFTPPAEVIPKTKADDQTKSPTPATVTCYDGQGGTDSEDDENDDTYQTAGGSSVYSEDMDDRLDEINDFSDDSIYFTKRYYDNNNKLDDTHSTKTMTTTGDLIDNDNYDDDDSHADNKAMFDAMDPEVAQALLEWRRQSLLKIDWFNMFATKSDLWRSTTLFQAFIPPEQQDPSSSSNQSSIATTSIDSLHFKGVPLDKAFRSYSKNIDYAKASVSDIDQALQVFAQLYWECNPSKLFQCAELVYIIIHSLMLFNTDVHAGQEHTTMDEFCNSTIKLVLAHQASIPIMLFDSDGESTWQQAMTECLQSLYKSVKRSSLLPSNQLQPWTLATTTMPSSIHENFEKQDQSKESMTGIRLDTAFNDMFITEARPDVKPKKSTSTPQKKQKQRHQRSNSLLSTPSWTLLRRKDTHRTKIGPYKEGPLSCQLSGEPWKICWVILHLGHLHIYHHRLGETTPISKENHSTTLTTTNISSSEANKTKVKKRFMQHLTPSATVTNFSGSNHGQVLKKKEPYQEVDIHLGNTFCERHGPHVFLLQLANGNSTYIFDCGSESQVDVWIRDCNYWAARETKIVLSRGSSSNMLWKRPPPPAGASVLDKKGQQQAIDTHLIYLEAEFNHHLQQPGWASGAWQDKKMYLELEIRKYQCYHDSICQ